MSDLDSVAGQGGEGLRSTGLSGCPKIPNNKSQTNHNEQNCPRSAWTPTLRVGSQFQNTKPVSVIWYWNFEFVCNLVLGIWDFVDYIIPREFQISTQS